MKFTSGACLELLERRQMLSSSVVVSVSTSLTAELQNAITFAQQQLNLTMTSDLGNNANNYPNYTASDGTWVLQTAEDWSSGAFPASLWQMYELTGNSAWKTEALKWTAPLAAETGTTSDTYLQIYAPFILDYDLTGDPQAVQNIIAAAAAKITTFNSTVGAFQTNWRASTSGNPAANFGVLIDQTMDMQQVFWAAAQTGNTAWYNDAVAEMTTVENYLVRADGSTAQWGYFNSQTGQFIDDETFAGYSNSSTWSRGQAWAIYSFANVYKATGRSDFLATDEKLANYFINNLPSDSVPYWDFDAPNIPNTYRDTSAAAIGASGLLQLAKIDPNTANAQKYYNAAASILGSLASSAYLAQGTSSHAVLLHGAGLVPVAGGVPDASLVYGDYYFLEATNLFLSDAPTSSVLALPTTETSAAFTVSWSGQDDTRGSGIASYSIYVSDNGGAFTPWLTDTTETSATYDGVTGNTYGFYCVATDNVGNVQPTPSAAQATTAVTVPPQVVNVVVDGSAWSGSFLGYLAGLSAANVGGYSIPTGSAQLNTLPWTNLDQINIVFNQNVNVVEGSLQLLGVNVASYSFSGFSYDASTDTATWTLTQPIGADKLLIDLSDSVTNTSGIALDGEWSDGVSSYPSGNGTPGGAFMFSLNVLPGDENQSGGVSVLDTVSVAHLQGSNTSTPATFSIFADVNGSGGINIQDTLATNSRQGSTLPSGSPSVPSVSSQAVVASTATVVPTFTIPPLSTTLTKDKDHPWLRLPRKASILTNM